MAADRATKAAWLKRALNVDVAMAATAGTQTGVDEKIAEHSLRQLANCRLAWVKIVGMVHAQTQALKATVLEACKSSGEYTDAQLAMIEQALQNVDNMVSGVDESLVDMVDAVINAAQGPPRIAAQRAAVAKTDELLQYVTTDEDFGLIDQNEYMPTNVRASTVQGLTVIGKILAGA